MPMSKEEKIKRGNQQRGGLPSESDGKLRTAIRDREDRAQIEHELATGKSVRAIARKYNVHEAALYRHRKLLPPQLKAAYLVNFLKPGEDLEKLKQEESDSWLRGMASQRARLLLQQDKAMEEDNEQAVARLAGKIHQNMEIVGRYLGELQQHSTHTIVNLTMTPEWLAFRTKLMKALKPYPDAMRAVAQALHSGESDAAQQISQPKMIDVTPALPSPRHDEA
jgi:transposase-like protein